MEESLSLGHLFLRHCKTNSGSESFLKYVDKNQFSTMTYREFLQTVYETVKALNSLGIDKDDKIVCYLEETHDLLPFIISCSIIGVVPTPISPNFSKEYTLNISKRVDGKAIFTTPDKVQNFSDSQLPVLSYFGGVLENFESLRFINRTSNFDGKNFYSVISYLEEYCQKINLESTFMIQPTSGSTGIPKLVVRQQKSFFRYAKFVGNEILKEKTERLSFAMLPALTHAFGLHMLTTAISLNSEILIPDKLDTKADLNILRSLEPVVLPMVPRIAKSLYEQYRDQPGLKRSIFGKKARFVLSAGGKSDPKIMEEFEKQNLKCLEFYGSSETGIISLTPFNKRRPGCAGLPVADLELKISDDGEIGVKSPGLMLSYFGEPKLTVESYDEHGFYLTGDIGFVDDEGYLSITGRKKDTINTPEGTNIYPERLENNLESLAWVSQSIVIGNQRPHLSAILSFKERRQSSRRVKKIKTSPNQKKEDILSCRREKKDRRGTSSLKSFIEKELEELNDNLEDIEKIKAVEILYSPLDESVYQIVGSGKVRRDRKEANRVYSDKIEKIYSASKKRGGQKKKKIG